MTTIEDVLTQLRLNRNKLAASIRSMQRDLDQLNERITNTKKTMAIFLGECAKRGITRISIGVRDTTVPASMDWPFHSTKGSVFSFVPKKNQKGQFPPVWDACEISKISDGCGNADQHAVDDTYLIEGVFRLKAGKWIKTK